MINYLLVPIVDNSKLSSIFLNVGCTYIGVTVISFSFMTFVTQINIERMPYGLFYYFSKDSTLLAYFISIFVLSLAFTSLNLFKLHDGVGYLILLGLIISFFIVFFLVKSYGRIFQLINPIEQLKFLLKMVLLDLSEWNREADSHSIKSEKDSFGINQKRLDFLNQNSHWLDKPYKALHFCNVYIRRYFTLGEKEICGQALGLIIVINQEYINVKGNTFYNHDNFINHNKEIDPFINETLEQMKRDIQFSISNKDEELAKVIIRTTSKLVDVYLKINYPNNRQSKNHASLASTYCDIFSVQFLNNGMWSALSESIDLLGSNASMLMPYDEAFILAIRDIENMAYRCLKLKKDSYFEKCILQLAELVLTSIKTNLNNNEHVLKVLQKSLFTLSMTCLSPTQNILLNPLENYYSVDPTKFLAQLGGTIHELNLVAKDQPDLNRIRQNILNWICNVYELDINLIGKSIELESEFLYIVFCWISSTIKYEIEIHYNKTETVSSLQKTSLILNKLIDMAETQFGFDTIYRYSLPKEITHIGLLLNNNQGNNTLFWAVIDGLIKWSLLSINNNFYQLFRQSYIGVLKLINNIPEEKSKLIEHLRSHLKAQKIKTKTFIGLSQEILTSLESSTSLQWATEYSISMEDIESIIKTINEINSSLKK